MNTIRLAEENNPTKEKTEEDWMVLNPVSFGDVLMIAMLTY
jgi:hypothetical protein